MVGQLLTLPLRVGARGTQLALRAVEGVAGRAAMSALQVIGNVTRRGGSSPTDTSRDTPAEPPARPRSDRPAPPPRASEETGATGTGRTEPPAPIVTAPAPEDVEPPTAAEPAHVSAEPELVREEAEPGAEDGAGASVNVRPPWEGYEQMGARDVIARLGEASAAELAAVQLYESSNRSRQTVLEAVERRLKAANGRG